MRKICLFISVALLLYSCKSLSSSDKRFADLKNSQPYKLHLNPDAGTAYHYDINNETTIKFKIDDKEVENANKSSAGVLYSISKDSSGNFIFKTNYDKIFIHTKSGDQEVEYDASRANISIDPVEKTMGVLLNSPVSATITPTGVVKKVDGYKEITEKLLAKFDPADENGKNIARIKWEDLFKRGMIENNMEQLFKIFPDSAIHIHDRWQLKSTYPGDINLKTKTNFILKDISEEIATLASESEVESDTTSNLMGYQVASTLKGSQSGVYEMDARTGMLINSKIDGKVEGSIVVMGREIPITIETKIRIKGVKK